MRSALSVVVLVALAASDYDDDRNGARGAHANAAQLEGPCAYDKPCVAGQRCAPCPEGTECWDISNIDGAYPKPVCVRGDVCRAAGCSGGCAVLEPVPGIVTSCE